MYRRTLDEGNDRGSTLNFNVEIYIYNIPTGIVGTNRDVYAENMVTAMRGNSVVWPGLWVGVIPSAAVPLGNYWVGSATQKLASVTLDNFLQVSEGELLIADLGGSHSTIGVICRKWTARTGLIGVRNCGLPVISISAIPWFVFEDPQGNFEGNPDYQLSVACQLAIPQLYL